MRLVLLSLLLLSCFACGVKGPPLPPETQSAEDVATAPVKGKKR